MCLVPPFSRINQGKRYLHHAAGHPRVGMSVLSDLCNYYRSCTAYAPGETFAHVRGPEPSLCEDVEASGASPDESTAEAPSAVWAPVQYAEQTLQTFQEATGLPWWGALIGYGVLLRLATWPLTIMQLKALDSLKHVSARAHRGARFLRGDAPYPAPLGLPPGSMQKGTSGAFALVHALSRAPGTTSIFWMAGPLIQVRQLQALHAPDPRLCAPYLCR